MPARTATKAAENAFKIIEATVTSKGQVTLPKALRRELGIDAGSRVRFTLGGDGKAQVEKVTYSLDDLWRMAAAREKPRDRMSFDEMDEAKERRIW